MPSRWAPFAEIASALHRRRSSLSGRHRLAIDVSEDKECCYVKASVPGFLPEQLRVDIQDNVLTISGLRRADDTAHDAGAQGGEQTDVHFTRSFVLPPEAACELAEATLDDEVLMIRIPKRSRGKGRRIEIRLGQGSDKGRDTA